MWRSLAASREALEFGFESGHHVYADHIHAESARTTCRLHTAQGSETLVLAAPGLPNLRNALAATACAAAAGAPLAAIVRRTEERRVGQECGRTWGSGGVAEH